MEEKSSAMHYLGNKGSPYSGFYSPLPCIAWVYFTCRVAAQAHPADAAYLHGVVVTLSPATHASRSLSLFRQQNGKERENCSPLQKPLLQVHTIPSLGFLPISCHREQQDKGTCSIVLWMRSACNYCIYHFSHPQKRGCICTGCITYCITYYLCLLYC